MMKSCNYYENMEPSRDTVYFRIVYVVCNCNFLSIYHRIVFIHCNVAQVAIKIHERLASY